MEKNGSGLREVGQEELAEAVGGIGTDGKRSVLVYMCSSCKIIKKVIGRQGMAAPECPVCHIPMNFIKAE